MARFVGNFGYLAIIITFSCRFVNVYAAGVTCTLGCPSGWTKVPTSAPYNCFWSPPAKVIGSYSAVESYCQSLNPESHIASVINKAEYDWMNLQVTCCKYLSIVTKMVTYVGGSSDSVGVFDWTDGTKWTAWAPNSKSTAPFGTPNSCLILNAGNPYFWSSGSCEFTTQGIGFCKMKPTNSCEPITTRGPTTPMPTCSTFLQDQVDYIKQATNGFFAVPDYKTLTGLSLTQCTIACLNQKSQCFSFDWNQSTLECRLITDNVLLSGCSAMTPEPNWSHYDMMIF